MKHKKVLSLRRLRPYVAVAVIFIVAGLLISVSAAQVVAAPPSQSLDEGEDIFGQICAACHTIGGGALIGPDLEGVSERREASWMKVHIQTPSVHHDQGDLFSVANLEKYGLQMPALGLNDQQVEAVVAFLQTGESASSAIPDLYAPTLAAGALAVVVLTLLGLRTARKRVEVRP